MSKMIETMYPKGTVNAVRVDTDTLFADGGFGRFDFKYGDRAVLGASLSRLLSMDGDIVIYPGHGRASTIREEQRAMRWFERC